MNARPGILLRLWGVAATILSVLYTAILIFPATLGAFFAHGHAASPVIRIWAWLALRTCGVRVELEGFENLDGLDAFVLVSNHQSIADILLGYLYIPRETRFVAKRELRKVPLIGFAMERAENIVIDRQSGGQTIRRALEVVRHGYSICVFAEGHRYSDNRVHEFNDGGAWLAIKTGLPCVPMTISGTLAIMPRGARFVIPGRRVRITLGKPIPTAGLKSADRTALTRELEQEVRAALHIFQ